jgi:hypothetical protein
MPRKKHHGYQRSSRLRSVALRQEEEKREAQEGYRMTKASSTTLTPATNASLPNFIVRGIND